MNEFDHSLHFDTALEAVGDLAALLVKSCRHKSVQDSQDVHGLCLRRLYVPHKEVCLQRCHCVNSVESVVSGVSPPAKPASGTRGAADRKKSKGKQAAATVAAEDLQALQARSELSSWRRSCIHLGCVMCLAFHHIGQWS